MEASTAQGENVNKKSDRYRVSTQVGVNIANLASNGQGGLYSSLFIQIQGSTGMTLTQLGLVSSVTPLGQAFITPLWGFLGDHYSRRILLALGCIVWGLFTLLEGIGTSILYFMAMGTCAGIGVAFIVPTTQSLLSDTVKPGWRGSAYGLLGLTGTVGVIFGSLFVFMLVVTNNQVGGLDPWQWVFISYGIIGFVAGALVLLLVKDPVRGCMEPELGKNAASGRFNKARADLESYKSIFANPTFWLIAVQGVAGSMPWMGLLFLVVWFEYVGFSSLVSAFLYLMIYVGLAVGSLLGGLFGDLVERWRPWGRVLICQISIAFSIIALSITLLVIPRETSSLFAYAIAGAALGLCSSWNVPQNTAMLSRVILPEVRSFGYSLVQFFKGISGLGALATVMVSLIATFHGYLSPAEGQSLQSLSSAFRMNDATALAQGMLWVAIIPWILSLVLYIPVYLTFPRDAKKASYILKARAVYANTAGVETGNDRKTLPDS
jgi:MFS family permease